MNVVVESLMNQWVGLYYMNVVVESLMNQWVGL